MGRDLATHGPALLVWRVLDPVVRADVRCCTTHRSEELQMIETTEVWTTPDFVEYETPMEVTAYAARME
ncbi:hypothetical protein GCM10023192_54460 [Amycolatopsis samaneae]